MPEKVTGPKAPKDPTAKRPYFYIMQSQEVFASPQPDGRGIQFIYEDGRFADCCRRVGHITDEEMLRDLPTTAGFRRIVHSIGVSISHPETVPVIFALQMYPATPGDEATTIRLETKANGDEQLIVLSDVEWMDTDNILGQIRFEFEHPDILATVDVRLYLNDGYTAPEQIVDRAVDFDSDACREMIGHSLLHTGRISRIKAAIDKAERGEEVTLAFIGGSVTQGAGATPIHKKSYARQCANAFADRYCGGDRDRVRLIKAGVGGTPSELGMIRFRRDVLRDDTVKPDVIVIEFAVNDAGDETEGDCFESLVRKAYALPWNPAVVLLFAVFSDDYNLQDRLAPIGEHYDLPMVSIKDAVTPQFNLSPAAGRVISKNQFFYDQFHPSNNGHRIMCDSLMTLFDAVAGMSSAAAGDTPEAPLGAEFRSGRFETVELLDRHDDIPAAGARIDAGSFTGTDEIIQRVEMDSAVEPVPEFPYNWHYDGSSDAPADFVMKCRCTRLLAVFKDSDDPANGRAVVTVDGREVMTYNPLDIGWNHCNAVIICDGEECSEHEVRIQMASGDERKRFTILGFGVVM